MNSKKFKKLAAAAILFVLALTFWSVNALPSIIKNWYLRVENYRDITVHEAYAIITYQSYRDVVVLDVRSEGEFNGTLSAGHIAGAIHIEWTDLEANLSDPVHCPLIGHEDDTIIVYCKTGGRSANASEVLASHGFKIVYNMVGGIDAWTYPAWYYPVVVEAPPTYTDISVHDAYEMITNGSFPNLVIVDVRTPAQYAVGHIENAINIPYYSDEDFGTRLGPLAGHENDEIIVYCRGIGCPLSPKASQYLVNHGFTKVYDMLGGIDAWKTVEFLETDLNEDGTVSILDIVLVAQAFGLKYNETDGMYWHGPACKYCPHTSARADLNQDEIINILDIAVVARDYDVELPESSVRYP